MDVTAYAPAPSLTAQPPGYRSTAAAALVAAEHAPAMIALHRREHPLHWQVLEVAGHFWEVIFVRHDAIVGDVVLSARAQVLKTYTGPLAAAPYARGHYGDVFDAPWVWGPLGLLFLVPLLLLRGERRAVWWARVDIALLLTFGVSYALFDAERLEAAVWAVYPCLFALLSRMLVRGLRARRAPARLELAGPVWLLGGGLLVLAAARVGLALAASHVMDVGGAAAIGAYRILHGQSLYFASINHPDTYGPVAYLVYAPFQLIWPGASWFSYLPSVRAATITFDLLTIAALVLLGRRTRRGRAGLKLGLALGWLWAACPFTALGVVKNTNDGLLALLFVLGLLALRAPAVRGALLGLAAAAKFFPAIMLPLVMAGRGERRGARTLAAFTIAGGGMIALFLPPGGVRELWSHTLGFQLTRADVFSPWALHAGLTPVKDALELAGAALAVLVAVRPRGPRSTAQVGALSAALVIAVQLPALHWFYLYIMWFAPLVLVAALGEVSRPVVPAPPCAGEDDAGAAVHEAEEPSGPVAVLV